MQGQSWQFALLWLPGLAEDRGGKKSKSGWTCPAGGGAVWPSERRCVWEAANLSKFLAQVCY